MARPTRILVVEDEKTQRTLLAGILKREGFGLDTAACGADALTQMELSLPDLVLADWRMPGMSGGALLTEIRRRSLPCSVIIMTAYGSIAHAVEAIRMGADDYLAKPFERDALLLAVHRVLRTRTLESENRRLKAAITEQDRFGVILGRAPAMQRLYRTLEKIAGTDATVLVLGESGTGKELVARTLHSESRRREGPFVAVNCAAIPESLLEAELFGHVKGAFTGAHRRRLGRILEADGGTLFLDEISSMPITLQPALLRVLQERQVTPLGGEGETAFDARVVAASNRDLAAMVAEGSFREDLYYRLNVVPIRIPPLRERREDIPLLAGAMLELASERHGIPMGPLRKEVLKPLIAYGWPGNVRELANVVERMVLLAEADEVREEDLPPEILSGVDPSECLVRLPANGLIWAELEVSLLTQAINRADGNRTGAARLLGLSYKTFLYRLEKHKLA